MEATTTSGARVPVDSGHRTFGGSGQEGDGEPREWTGIETRGARLAAPVGAAIGDDLGATEPHRLPRHRLQDAVGAGGDARKIVTEDTRRAQGIDGRNRVPVEDHLPERTPRAGLHAGVAVEAGLDPLAAEAWGSQPA